MIRIFVGNLGTEYNETLLRSIFEAYGRVEDVRVNRTCALVQMPDEAEAQRAVSDLSKTFWFLQPFIVSPVAKNAA